MITTKSKPKSGFYIGVGCPGCGGSLQLDTDFFVLTCEYCGSVIRVVQPDTPAAYLIQAKVSDSEARFTLDRYLKERDEPLTGSGLMFKKLYYPYWKVEGTVLKLRNKVERKVYYSETDSSQEYTSENPKTEITISPYNLTIGAGSPMPSVPDSLGIRPETITILPFSSENIQEDYDPLPILRPFDRVQQRVRLAVATLGDIDSPEFGKNITRLFDPVFSLVYFPYMIVETYNPAYRRFALDGLTGRVLGDVNTADGKGNRGAASGIARETNFGNVHFSIEAASAPSVESASYGFDQLTGGGTDYSSLETDADDELLETPPQIEFGELHVDFHRCGNCGVDLPPEMSYVYVCQNCYTMTMLGNSRYELNHIDMAEYDDSQKATLVPFWWLKLPAEDMTRFRTLFGGFGTPDRIVMPALRSNNHEAILRVAKRMTCAAAEIPLHPVDEIDDRFLHVRVSLSEAIADAEMLLIRDLMALGQRSGDLDVELRPVDVGLMYVPFRLENYFYVDAVTNAISMERHLIS